MSFTPFRHRIRVRYGETDRMGVVYHAEYLAWMDEARTEYLRRKGMPYHELEASGIGLAVRRVELRYRAPARFGHDVDVLVTVDRVRGASIAFSYRIEEAETATHLADAFVELAAMEFGQEVIRPVPLPKRLRELLEP